MVSLTVTIPDELRDKAQLAAEQRGVSLDEFVQRCLWSVLDRKNDPLFADTAAYGGDAPADLSEVHDRYLYGDAS